MPDRPFKVGDVVVTTCQAYDGVTVQHPAGTLCVVETVVFTGPKPHVFGTLPLTGVTGACFWFSEIRLVEDPDA